MSEVIRSKFESIFGERRLNEITNLDDDKKCFTNSKEIFCECKTLILKPNNAKLILPTETMMEMEKDLVFLNKTGDNYFKNLVQGCYWLIDDMYKFEQIGYTKEIKSKNLTNNINDGTDDGTNEQNNQQKSTSAPNGLRYLLCAECNLCPLGWFDSKTKESYLHVW